MLVDQIIITGLIVAVAPIISLLAGMTGLFNLGKKELDEFFATVGTYVKKRNAENLIKTMFPEKIGIVRAEENEIEANNESIRSFAADIDSVRELGLMLFKCKSFAEKYFLSLYGLICLGVGFLFAHLMGIQLAFLNPFLALISAIVVVYVLLTFLALWMRRNKLKILYEKEYDI